MFLNEKRHKRKMKKEKQKANKNSIGKRRNSVYLGLFVPYCFQAC